MCGERGQEGAGRVGSIRTKINIFVRRVGTREVIPSRGDNGLVGISLSRHDDDKRLLVV